MFSGIVEATASVLSCESRSSTLTVRVARPPIFQDLKSGDSISCNGVCLTLEAFDDQSMQFTLAVESLAVLKIDPNHLTGQIWNLERSLRFGDRVHGHLVTGHVEALGKVIKSQAVGESWILEVEVPEKLSPCIWPKGSICLQGVSLTVNRFDHLTVEVCLIPETLKRTNLAGFQTGDAINVETDYLAKAYFKMAHPPLQGKDHGLPQT